VEKLRGLCSRMEEVLTAHLRNPESASFVPRFLAVDTRFHRQLAALSGSDFIVEAVEHGLAARYTPLSTILQRLTPGANRGHEELVNAISSHDGVRAENVMRDHVTAARDQLMFVLDCHLKTARPGSLPTLGGPGRDAVP